MQQTRFRLAPCTKSHRYPRFGQSSGEVSWGSVRAEGADCLWRPLAGYEFRLFGCMYATDIMFTFEEEVCFERAKQVQSLFVRGPSLMVIVGVLAGMSACLGNPWT